jgi:hypothetical protein
VALSWRARVLSQPLLNTGCALAHEHLCLAYETLVSLFHQARRNTTAYQVKSDAILNQGCPAEPPNRTLPDGPIF